MLSAKQAFSQAITDALRARYGRVPSAAVTARDFNLRNADTPPISEETARRWMRGLSLPEGERLAVLVRWLELDLNKIFGDQSTCQPSLCALAGLGHQQELLALLNALNSHQLAALKNLITVGFLSQAKGQPPKLSRTAGLTRLVQRVSL
jgi:hypothetical protein